MQKQLRMTGRILQKLLISAILMVTFHVAFPADELVCKSDTLSIEDLIMDGDTCVGPEMMASKDVYIPKDVELLQFSELLSKFQLPVFGKIISKYGWRRGRMHTGTDIKLNLGDTVYSAYSGEVFRACRYYGYGNLVIIKHPHALETYYGHLSKFLVKAGDTIKAGQAIALGGRTGRATGPHLHFEIRENRVAYNPELVYNFSDFKVRDDICDKEQLADLITDPKTGENISITRKGTSYLQEMGTNQMVEYVIKTGDSLWDIARKCNTSVSILCELNNITTGSILRIGKVLRISSQPAGQSPGRPVSKPALQTAAKSVRQTVSKPQVKSANQSLSQEIH
jgi:LysM repeat protein